MLKIKIKIRIQKQKLKKCDSIYGLVDRLRTSCAQNLEGKKLQTHNAMHDPYFRSAPIDAGSNTLLLILAFIQHGESGAAVPHDFLPHKFILSLFKLIVLDLDFLVPQKFQSYQQREAQAQNIEANNDLSRVG